jgi:hypothetical protein
MIEVPFEGRAKIEHDGLSTKIYIPSRKNWFIIIFLLFWMVGWFWGESSTIKEVLDAESSLIDGFMIFWLLGWTLGGLFAIVVLFWTLFGCEIVTIEKPIIRIEKGLFNTGIFKKNYDLPTIKNLELSPESTFANIFSNKNKIGDFWGLTGGKIRFDYGMKTIKFAIGVDEAEARHLIEEIKRRGNYRD